MNSKSLEQAKTLVKAAYIRQGEQALNGRRKLVGGRNHALYNLSVVAVLSHHV